MEYAVVIQLESGGGWKSGHWPDLVYALQQIWQSVHGGGQQNYADQ